MNQINKLVINFMKHIKFQIKTKNNFIKKVQDYFKLITFIPKTNFRIFLKVFLKFTYI